MKRVLVGLLATLGVLTLLLAGGAALTAWLLLPRQPELPERHLSHRQKRAISSRRFRGRGPCIPFLSRRARLPG